MPTKINLIGEKVTETSLISWKAITSKTISIRPRKSQNRMKMRNENLHRTVRSRSERHYHEPFSKIHFGLIYWVHDALSSERTSPREENLRGAMISIPIIQSDAAPMKQDSSMEKNSIDKSPRRQRKQNKWTNGRRRIRSALGLTSPADGHSQVCGRVLL